MKKFMSFFHVFAFIFMLFVTLNESEIFAQPINREKPNQPKTKDNTNKQVQLVNLNNRAKYALLIGNNSYQSIPLSNPVNDVALISKSLKQLNFNVTEKKNLKLNEMKMEIEKFSQNLPTNSIGLFYFAGHGIQVSGKNFLLPIDYKEVKTEKDLLETQIDLDSIISSISKKSGLTIIILDACRDNGVNLELSFETERGFAIPKKNTGGIYIAYSTSPGNTAYDGVGGNSPYSKALAQNLLINPGRLEDIFIKTRIDVRNQTLNFPNGEQIPWENGSLSTIFYLTEDRLKTPIIGNNSNKILISTLKPKLPFNIKNLLNFSFNVPHIDKYGSSTIKNKSNSYFTENVNLLNLEMVSISGGTFEMGSDYQDVESAFQDTLISNENISKNDAKEEAREVITSEMPKHTVNISGFFMSKYEITQLQWQKIMGSLPNIPKEFIGSNKPVINVTWEESVKFCDILSAKTGRSYRLPSEAEWEYAARSGNDTLFGFGENINSNYVNFFGLVPFGLGKKGEYRQQILEVGKLGVANNFGLFDMQGNVSEWCQDYWHWDYNGAPTDGKPWNFPATKKDDDDDDPALYRVIRGGSFDTIGNDCRSARRKAKPAVDGFSATDIGFRVVLTP